MTSLSLAQTKTYVRKTIGGNPKNYLAKIGLLAVVYVVTAKLGLSLAFATEQVTTIWPPTGISLAALLVMGYRFWPGIFLGAFAANALTDEPLAVALGIAAGNTLEALIGAYLLRRFIRFSTSFSKLSDFLGLAILAGTISTIVSASIGSLSLMLGKIINPEAYLSTWWVWWVGDMMGALIFAPLLLITFKSKLKSLRQSPAEAAALLLITCALSFIVFSSSGSLSSLPYAVFPLVIWAAFRFKQEGAVAIVTLTSAIAVWGTINSKGPFTQSTSTEQNIIMLHTFLSILITTAMVMAIVVAQKQQNEVKLRRISEDLKEANRRVSNLLDGALDQPVSRLRTKVRAERKNAKSGLR